MPLIYLGATYHRKSQSANLLIYECKGRKRRGCNGQIKFAVSKKGYKGKLQEFRPHSIGCEFYETNPDPSEVFETDPPQTRVGSQNETQHQNRSKNTVRPFIDLTGSTSAFVIEGTRLNQYRHQPARDVLRPQDLEYGTVTSSPIHQAGPAGRSGSNVGQAGHNRIHTMAGRKPNELSEAIRRADQDLERLENCMQEFADTCDRLRAPENDGS